MSDLPICECSVVWPNQGHHPECPVKREIDRLRTRKQLITEACQRIRQVTHNVHVLRNVAAIEHALGKREENKHGR